MNDNRYTKYIDNTYIFYIKEEILWHMNQDITNCSIIQKMRLSDVVIFDGKVIKDRFMHIDLFIEGLQKINVVKTIYLDESSDD